MQNIIDGIGGIGTAPVHSDRWVIRYAAATCTFYPPEEEIMYKPEPIDTADVVLSDDLLALTERIAKNVHDVWALSRIREGWKYGEKKDSTAKTTPCLVPYEELPEEEKDYDRNTAFETLRLIVKLGYTISKTAE